MSKPFVITVGIVGVAFALFLAPAFLTSRPAAIGLSCGLLVLGFVGWELTSGSASLHWLAPSYRRRVNPGMFWLVVTLKAVLGLVLAGAALWAWSS